VSEGPHAIAVDVGDGAIRAYAEVSGHQLDADHGAGLEIGGVAHARLDFSARADALARLQAERAQFWCERFQRGAAEPAERDGVAISTMRASPAGVVSGLRRTCVRSRSASAMAARSTGPERMAMPSRAASCPGWAVLPAMGSFANGNAMATAPTSLPSI